MTATIIRTAGSSTWVHSEPIPPTSWSTMA
jgi:hypothetical protein